MKGPKKYGKYYWCVKSTLSRDGEIYVDADKVVVTEQGDLICSSINSGGDLIVNLGIAKGYWTSVFAAILYGWFSNRSSALGGVVDK